MRHFSGLLIWGSTPPGLSIKGVQISLPTMKAANSLPLLLLLQFLLLLLLQLLLLLLLLVPLLLLLQGGRIASEASGCQRRMACQSWVRPFHCNYGRGSELSFALQEQQTQSVAASAPCSD